MVVLVPQAPETPQLAVVDSCLQMCMLTSCDNSCYCESDLLLLMYTCLSVVFCKYLCNVQHPQQVRKLVVSTFLPDLLPTPPQSKTM